MSKHSMSKADASRIQSSNAKTNGGNTVRRHINWNNWPPDLREDLAHLVQDIKRRFCGIASAGFPSFSV